MVREEYEISKLGVCLTVIALLSFTVLLFQVFSYFALILGPIVTLAVARPGYEDGPMLWEKRNPIEEK